MNVDEAKLETAAAEAAFDPGTGAGQDRSLAAYLIIGADGAHHLMGSRCSNCGEAMVVAKSRACPKCAAVGSLEPLALSETGKLYAYSIVYRSFPGVKTPIISAIVQLDDGAFVRGNLEEIEPDPAKLAFDLRVRVTVDRLDDGEGGTLVRPIFVPA